LCSDKDSPRHPNIEFVVTDPADPLEDELGRGEFLQFAVLSDNATRDEVEIVKRLRFKGSRPMATLSLTRVFICCLGIAFDRVSTITES
jgi:hypothetical protein